VLDLSNLSKSAMRRFVADFAERLYEKNRNPLHLIIDEADEFAPQRIAKGRERTFGAVDEIVRRGRIRGLGVTLVTQRSAASTRTCSRSARS
jgi:DNA helicase HerA-like ATPase